MAASVQTRTPRIFISYSHKDQKVKERLVTHLNVPQADVWDDTRIKPGDEWLSEIEQAMAGADVAILLISADFLTSRFVLSKEVPVLLERREREGLLVYPVLVEDCAWDQVEWLAKMQIRMWEGKPLPGGRERNTALAGIARDIAERFKEHPERPPEPRMSTAKLPVVSPMLFGRDRELALLDAAWEDANTNIVSLVAFGGVGKTALVSKWLNQKRCRGADCVFGWSFYSQGAAEDRQTSAEPFIEKALEWFGDPDPKQGSAWEKGERLAGLIERHRTLLILDGLEPLQHPPGPMTGQLKEPSLQSLLRTLGRQNRGLCILSTRLAVADLVEFEGTTMRRLELENLSPKAGAAYLKKLGVEGTPQELRQASRDFGGHALALGLLGNYLKVVCQGDVRKRDTIGALLDEEKKGGHARRVMRSYARYFEGQPEGAILRLMGLFDRPADGPAIEVLKAAPAIEGLTGELVGLQDRRWKLALHHLREAKLLAPEDKHEPETLDCHPLVREHFADEVRQSNPTGWQKAHLRLYEHYSKQGKECPDTLEEMMPLFAAVYHGCQAGRHQEAADVIYWRRILRRDEFFLFTKFGAFGANLALLANFFDPPWRRPVAGLTEFHQGWVLHAAGFGLRALGRLSEALEPMEAGLEAFIPQEKWKQVAISAGNLSGLHLTLGNVAQAVDVARRSVEYADRSGDDFQRLSKRAALAHGLHQAG